MRTSGSLRVLGVMTGTSCDGLDAACIDINPNGWMPLWSASAAYPKDLRRRVLEYQRPRTRNSPQTWLELHRSLGEWYGRALSRIIASQKKKPDVIANHGQTIAHFPAPNRKGITLQLGDPTRIVHATGLTVLSNFREGDMAAGGQGAPLAPLFHRLLAHHLGQPEKGVAIHNIGGISNLTYIGKNREILAFDTGPGNIWIDAAAELATGGRLKMDLNGKLARRGLVDWRAVERVLRHPSFGKPAQKSTGRDEFTFELLLSETQAKGVDLVATATAVTIESIARAYETCVIAGKRPLAAVYLCGGGAKNPALIGALQERLPKVTVSTLSDAGIDGQLVEAQAFAFFGFITLMGQPLGGSWTGAKGFGPPGHIVPGMNWATVVEKLSSFTPS